MEDEHKKHDTPIPPEDLQPQTENPDEKETALQTGPDLTDPIKDAQSDPGDPKSDPFAIAGFILGLVSVVSCIFFLGIPGLVFFVKGLKSRRKNLSMAGLTLSALGTAITVLALIFILFMRSTILKYGSR